MELRSLAEHSPKRVNSAYPLRYATAVWLASKKFSRSALIWSAFNLSLVRLRRFRIGHNKLHRLAGDYRMCWICQFDEEFVRPRC